MAGSLKKKPGMGMDKAPGKGRGVGKGVAKADKPKKVKKGKKGY